MNNKISVYLEENNKLFNGNVLTICYKASEKEVKEFNLTSNNVLLFIKHKKIDSIKDNYNCNYLQMIKEILSNEADERIILRIQSECFLGMYGDSHCDCEEQRIEAINIIAKNGGIFIHLPQEAQGWGLHYKLQELELQVSGRMQSGEFVGKLDRDKAQKKILKSTGKFKDNRDYGIIYKVLSEISISNLKFALITDSNKKIEMLNNEKIDVIKYSDYMAQNINNDNLSEYLIKIYNMTHVYDRDTMSKIVEVIKQRTYTERALSALLNIIDRIKKDVKYELPKDYKDMLLEVYNEIICGEEKTYVVGDEKHIKTQNSFSCKVDCTIFKTLCSIYGKNIFDRISYEKIYYFKNNVNEGNVRIRTSDILDCVNKNCKLFKGQKHAEYSVYDEAKKKMIQKETSLSKLRSYFENTEYSYVKRVEMLTIISEEIIPGLCIYIKRIPNIENRVMDVYGNRENIQSLINKVLETNSNALLNIINDEKLSRQDFSNNNLRFADKNSIIEEECSVYALTKE